jgi:hypothetical protein
VTLPETTPRSSVLVLGACGAGARGSCAGTDGAVLDGGGVDVTTAAVSVGAAALVAPRWDPLSPGVPGEGESLPMFDPLLPATGSLVVDPVSLPEQPVMKEDPRNSASTLHPE